MIEVLLRDTEFLPTRLGKYEVYEYKFNVSNTVQLQSQVILAPCHTQPEQVLETKLKNNGRWNIIII
jgi:hypothetical protein